MKFANWWNNRLQLYCYDDIPRGIFTDQRWVDLAPAYFDVYIMKNIINHIEESLIKSYDTNKLVDKIKSKYKNIEISLYPSNVVPSAFL